MKTGGFGDLKTQLLKALIFLALAGLALFLASGGNLSFLYEKF